MKWLNKAMYFSKKVRINSKVFTAQQSWFSLQTVWRARSSVRTPVTGRQCLIPIWMAHQTQTTQSSCLLPVRMAQRMRITKSTCLQECPNAKVKTANGEAFPCNCPDVKSSRLDAFQQNIGFNVTRPDTQSLVQTPPSRNPNLSRIRIFEAYLKRLLGIVNFFKNS